MKASDNQIKKATYYHRVIPILISSGVVVNRIPIKKDECWQVRHMSCWHDVYASNIEANIILFRIYE